MAVPPTIIQPRELVAAETVNTSDDLIVDDGLSVLKAKPAQVVNAVAPVATQAEALAGANNVKRMTALRVRQVVEAAGSGSFLAREWAENPEDVPVVPGGFSALHWSAKSEGSALEAEDHALATAADRLATDADRTAVEAIATDFGDLATAVGLAQTAAEEAEGFADQAGADRTAAGESRLAAEDARNEAEGHAGDALAAAASIQPYPNRAAAEAAWTGRPDAIKSVGWYEPGLGVRSIVEGDNVVPDFDDAEWAGIEVGGVQTIERLAALPTNSLRDGHQISVSELGGLFRYLPSSSLAASTNIVVPSSGIGRWQREQTYTRPFDTRAEFVAACAAGYDCPAGTVQFAGKWPYGRVVGSTRLSAFGLSGWEPVLDITPYHFGAAGDWDRDAQTGTDDTAAVQGAIDFLGTDGGAVHIMGRFRTTATIDVTYAGVQLVGDGASGEGFFTHAPSMIVGDHSAGPVVRFRHRYWGLKEIFVDGSTARKDGSAGTAWAEGGDNVGVLVDGEMGGGVFNDVRDGRMIDSKIANQPSHGFVGIGLTGCSLRGNQIQRCEHHAYIIDNGWLTGRASGDRQTPIIFDMQYNMANNNGGNGCIIGNPTNRVLRATLINNDFGRNCQNADNIRGLYQGWLLLEDSTLIGTAWGGQKDGDPSNSVGCALGGINISCSNERYISCLGAGVHVRNLHQTHPTSGISFQSFHALNAVVTGPPLATVFDVEEGITGIFIGALVRDQVQPGPLRICTPHQGRGFERRIECVVKSVDQFVTNTSTYQDDTTLFVDLLPYERTVFECVLFYDGPAGADLKVRFVPPADSHIKWGPSSGLVVGLSDAIAAQVRAALGPIELGTATGAPRMITFKGEVETKGTGGTFQLQWAQVVADAGNTALREGSYLSVVR